MQTSALIVAGGRGHRAGGEIPKQYQLLGGIPLITHSIARLLDHPAIDRVQVVIHRDDGTFYHDAIKNLADAKKLAPACFGGSQRQDSVRLGLEALAATNPTDLVLIHDAARPFVTEAEIDRLLAALTTSPGAILAVPVVDTLKRADEQGRMLGGADRTGLWRAQTPQAFHFQAILDAHRAAAGQSLTDDAAVAEQAGLAVLCVTGRDENFKVTAPEDFQRAERQLLLARPDIRVGQGFDVHAFDAEPGRRALVLAGIELSHSHGLAGHSDADVALHALTDALLGAIGDGDIGAHFPPSDVRWKGVASERFLRHAVDLVHKRDGLIAHLDLTIICEAPKVGPYREAMRKRIAGICGLPVDRVAVKATTTEKLGFTGRREGIAAQAVATVRLP